MNRSRHRRRHFRLRRPRPGRILPEASTLLALRTPGLYRLADAISEVLIYVSIVFAPWAIGTVQPWSIWTMNLIGYVLGLFLVMKWLVRRQTGFRPSRWGEPQTDDRAQTQGRGPSRWLPRGLAALTVVTLGYIAIYGINARATYLQGDYRFEYFDGYLRWLPHSYDRASTWRAFWKYLALAFYFWAARDWLLGKTRRERALDADAERDPAFGSRQPLSLIPSRLKRLLFLVAINGALISLAGILQRLDGTTKLLWLVEMKHRQPSTGTFGPFGYRANAAAYLNLVWPLVFGFYLVVRREEKLKGAMMRRISSGPSQMLIPFLILLGAAPFATVSRGGSLVAAFCLLGSLVIVGRLTHRLSWLGTIGLIVGTVAAGLLVDTVSGKTLVERFEALWKDKSSGREFIYKNMDQMSRDVGVWGAGPGTFASLYRLYMDPGELRAIQAHQDWRETRLTFGWPGLILVLALLVLAIALGWAGGVSSSGAMLLWLATLALAGCLLHAVYDFPLQIYSILHFFLLVSVICSIAPTIRSPVFSK